MFNRFQLTHAFLSSKISSKRSLYHCNKLFSSTKWPFKSYLHSSVQLLSHVWLCDPMDCSTAGLPVHRQLPEFTQTHVHWVGDAIQPSHPLSSPSLPALQPFPASGSFPMSQLFASGGQSIGVSASTSVLSINIQDWFPLGWTGWISLQSKGLQHNSSKESILWHSACFIAQLSHP